MSALSRIRSAFRSLFRKEELDLDLEEEIQGFEDMLIKEKLLQGLSAEQARRAARLEVGGVEQVKEGVRDIRLGSTIGTLLQDIRYAFRTLRKNPGFAIAAILTLALGIGSTTALFSTVNKVLLHRISFEDPDGLVVGQKTYNGSTAGLVSLPDFKDYREQCRSFEDLGAFVGGGQLTITGGAEPELVIGSQITANLFRILRVNPVAGRYFLPAEEERGAGRVALISYGFWQRRFGGAPDTVGRTLYVNGFPVTIVGVMPRGFHFLVDVDLWGLIASPIDPNESFTLKRDAHSYIMVGRLKPSVSIDQAQGEVAVVSKALEKEYPDTNKAKGLFLMNLHGYMVSDIRTGLLLLMATTIVVLLIACGNVAGLLLARGQRRLPEMALRAALGGSRRRLVRQLLTESVILTLLAGLSGIGIAYLLQSLLLRLLPLGELGISVPTVDPAALLFAILVSIVSGLAIGVIPAVRGTAVNLSERLKTATHSSEAGRSTRLRGSLVVLQVTASIVLLVVSSVLIRALVLLATVDLGFSPANLLTGSIRIQATTYSTPERRHAFFTSLLQEIQALPGVVSAGMINKLPIINPYQNWQIWPAEQPRPSPNNAYYAMARMVTPGYFNTMQIPLLKGRDIAENDIGDRPGVVVISEAVARTIFPNTDPIGRRVMIGWETAPFEVIGVVGDARLNPMSSSFDPGMYMSSAQMGANAARIAVRTTVDPNGIVIPIRDILRRKDPNALFATPATMTSILDDSLAEFRIVIVSAGFFSGIALILTAVGLYGMLAYHVSQRRNEIGIRLAMGATTANLIKMIVSKGMILVGVGLLLGIAASYPATLLIRQLLLGTQISNVSAYAGSVLVLIIVTALACFLPAWRATRGSLVEALRNE
jgi:predicted permease